MRVIRCTEKVKHPNKLYIISSLQVYCAQTNIEVYDTKQLISQYLLAYTCRSMTFLTVFHAHMGIQSLRTIKTFPHILQRYSLAEGLRFEAAAIIIILYVLTPMYFLALFMK